MVDMSLIDLPAAYQPSQIWGAVTATSEPITEPTIVARSGMRLRAVGRVIGTVAGPVELPELVFHSCFRVQQHDLAVAAGPAGRASGNRYARDRPRRPVPDRRIVVASIVGVEIAAAGDCVLRGRGIPVVDGYRVFVGI